MARALFPGARAPPLRQLRHHLEAAVDDTTPTFSPTGDPRMDQLLPYAARLVRATHDQLYLGVKAPLTEALPVYEDENTTLRALVVLLAAMCPDDASPEELLTWLRDPREYRRLRTAGVSAAQARILCVRAPKAARKGIA